MGTQHLALPTELRTDGERTLRDEEWSPQGLCLWPGRWLASVTGAVPPKRRPHHTRQSWMSLPPPSGLCLPTRRHLPHLWTGLRGREWSAQKGLSLRLLSPSRSPNQNGPSCPPLPRRQWGCGAQCPISAAYPCCWFSSPCIGPCWTCLRTLLGASWMLSLNSFLQVVFLSQVDEYV